MYYKCSKVKALPSNFFNIPVTCKLFRFNSILNPANNGGETYKISVVGKGKSHAVFEICINTSGSRN